MSFIFIRQDITKMKVDVIVNAANAQLRQGGGVCGAIFEAAGAKQLKEACATLSPIGVGEAVITPAFNLGCRYIIHAVGPIYSLYSNEENERLLRSAYQKSLLLAVEHGCESIAFPLISSGVYGYPKKEALKVAMSVIKEFLLDNELAVHLIVYDKDSFTHSVDVVHKVNSFISNHYVDEKKVYRLDERWYEEDRLLSTTPMVSTPLNPMTIQLDESFSEALFKLIDEKGMSDVDVYKRANIDRKLFSKIRSNREYTPSKKTAIALCIALQLSVDEMEGLLEKAGYSLSRSQKFDVVVEYFIIQKNYNIFEINEMLFTFDLPLLG